MKGDNYELDLELDLELGLEVDLQDENNREIDIEEIDEDIKEDNEVITGSAEYQRIQRRKKKHGLMLFDYYHCSALKGVYTRQQVNEIPCFNKYVYLNGIKIDNHFFEGIEYGKYIELLKEYTQEKKGTPQNYYFSIYWRNGQPVENNPKFYDIELVAEFLTRKTGKKIYKFDVDNVLNGTQKDIYGYTVKLNFKN
ncbi:hypothetical protein [Clostridium perfringens]|uniref:hypothetical protein n=1 Tax=Clostridium perfringens TaxID=1502 RepID=UPI00246987F6|nr:hypothetical protein [Clostridium perfringens]MDH5068061.1 hypothetical protein [Clostridium perfringens]